jgi:cysteine desulfurase
VSAVALELGVAPELARGALRISFGWSTTDADVEAAGSGIVDAATRLRAHLRDGAPA